MIRIDKMDAFAMVVRAMEKNDGKTASDIMKVISKSIKKEKNSNTFLQYIEIIDKKDEKLIKGILEKQGHTVNYQ